jgi:hypothetical protein
MKSKWFITCICLGVLGGTSACTGDEEAVIASDETAGTLSGAGEGKGPEKEAGEGKGPEKEAGKGKGPEKEAAKGDEGSRGEGEQLTNADCFVDSVPDSASMWAKTCISLAKSHPDTPFTPNDYVGMPEDCKPFVKQKCR